MFSRASVCPQGGGPGWYVQGGCLRGGARSGGLPFFRTAVSHFSRGGGGGGGFSHCENGYTINARSVCIILECILIFGILLCRNLNLIVNNLLYCTVVQLFDFLTSLTINNVNEQQ